MKNKLRAGLAVVAMMLAMVTSVGATTVTIDGGWYSADEFLTAPDYFTETWSFTANGNVNLFVTDWAVASDLFDVYDNGVLLGSTSNASGAGFTLDYDFAYADARWSSGTWLLTAGSHEISILSKFIPYIAGTNYVYPDSTVALKVESEVPEPGTMILLGTGLAGLAGFSARRKRKE